jgi:hypothetical protein
MSNASKHRFCPRLEALEDRCAPSGGLTSPLHAGLLHAASHRTAHHGHHGHHAHHGHHTVMMGATGMPMMGMMAMMPAMPMMSAMPTMGMMSTP